MRKLNPAARAYLDYLANSGVPAFNTLPPVEARARNSLSTPYVTPESPAVASVLNRTVPGPHGEVPIRIYRPLGAKAGDVLPVLVFFHGGGWMIGDLETHDVLCRQLANQTPCAVVAVDYRLSPEFRFPIAIDECVAATRWIAANAAALKLDRHRIAVGGDSAGGTLSAVISLEARELKLAFQLLIYPATDQAYDMPSHAECAEGYYLTRDLLLYFRDNYLDAGDYGNWRASPLKAGGFAGLPPALVITAGFDPLRDEGQEYARQLAAAGVAVQYTCYDDMIHGFIRLGKVIPDAQNAVDESARALGRAFGLLRTQAEREISVQGRIGHLDPEVSP